MMEQTKSNIELKQYIDERFEALEKLMNVNFELDRKAVEQYSKTNDEWKVLHNGLQRKLEEERGKYVAQERYDQNMKTTTDKMVEGFSRLDEKINMTRQSLDERRDSLMKNIEDKLFSNLKSESERHSATHKQMQTLIDANAEISNRGISDLNVWKISSQGSIRVILAVGGFVVAIVMALIAAVIRNWSK